MSKTDKDLKTDHILDLRNMVVTEYKSSCCDATVAKGDASGGHKHWMGYVCTECGNQSPLKMDDLLKEMKLKTPRL